MKYFYALLINLLIVAGVFAQSNNVVQNSPTKGVATINGKEVRYYVSADKKFLHLDTTNDLKVCQYTVANVKPEGFNDSFVYQDQHGVARTCYFKTLSTLSKKNMVSA